MAQAKLFCCPVLGRTWGPEVWAMSVPNHDKVSGQQFLISHLLQYKLGFFWIPGLVYTIFDGT